MRRKRKGVNKLLYDVKGLSNSLSLSLSLGLSK